MTLLTNQKTLLTNQKTLVFNQKTLLTNQKSLLTNQKTLLVNKKTQLTNQRAGHAPGLAAGRQGHGELHGVVGEVGGGEDLLEDVRSQLQPRVVGRQGIGAVTALLVLLEIYRL